jgi:hypothetical protein
MTTARPSRPISNGSPDENGAEPRLRLSVD